MSEALPPELVVGFLREQIAKNRDRAPALKSGALTFGVTRKTGLTDYFTLYIRPDDVALEEGAAPIDYEGPSVSLLGTAEALSAITRAESMEGLEVIGDRSLLKSVARCLGKGVDLYAVRNKK
ncbi:MAG: hypothetical protein U1E65_09385 [Myxococcota bacterium]